MSTIDGSLNYVLGTRDDELARLGFQHQVWLDETVRSWRDAGFGPGQHIIDLGCGPGFASTDLARLVGPLGHITAIDSSAKYLAHLEGTRDQSGLENISTIECDVEKSVPVEEITADGVFVRWLFCFLSDPKTAVSWVASQVKPGGTVVVIDYFNYNSVFIHPRNPTTEKLFDVYYESNRARGGDYDIGTRIPDLLVENGFSIRSIRPICHTARPGTLIWQWFRSFTSVYLPHLVDSNWLTSSEASSIVDTLDALETHPAAFFNSPPVIVIVAEKTGNAL